MLNQISVHNLTYIYESSPEAVLSDVSMTFSHGWTGVVGNNGTGKTTLLRIVSGALTGFEGNLNPDPSSYGGVYCAQPTEHLPDYAQDFALDYSADAVRLRSILDVDEDWIWRFDTLSHGERKRLQIAVALWQNPAVLALDEPTNHIDAATREQLVRALKYYDGVGLLVSHDRAFLDALVFQCLFFEDGKTIMRPGSYSEAREQSELERKR
jgi:ATPase subunit of ABC transporter with duplicated ATPase domains